MRGVLQQTCMPLLWTLRRQVMRAAPAVLVAACVGGEGGSNEPEVSGVVTYPESFSLPPNPRLAVALLGRTDDGSMTVIAAGTTAVEAGNPAFSLPYDPASVDPNQTYVVAARILDAAGDVFFISAGEYRVITGGYPARVEIAVLPAGVTGPLPARAARVAAEMGAFERVDGQWEQGDAASTISAYFDGPQLRYLEERMTIGQYGSAANAYYFEQGTLFFLESVKRVAMGTPGRDDRQEEIAMRALFAPDGTREEAMRWVDGAAAEMDEGELLSALRHAEGLREAAMQLAAGR